jgi:hypothetical protein
MAGKAKKSEGDGGGGGSKGKSPMLMMIVVLIAGLAGGVFAGKNFLAPKAPPPPKPPTVGKTLDLGSLLSIWATNITSKRESRSVSKRASTPRNWRRTPRRCATPR